MRGGPSLLQSNRRTDKDADSKQVWIMIYGHGAVVRGGMCAVSLKVIRLKDEAFVSRM